MNDLGSITALMTAAGAVIGLANKSNTVEANQKILELQQRLSDVHQTFAELFQENQSLKEQNRTLQDELNAEAMYPFRESVRWKKSMEGGEDDGPFCPICFANKKILMPLRFRSRMTTSGVLTFICPEVHSQNPGLGRGTEYQVEETSIKKGRYSLPA
jgi:hypothetical protein